MIRFPLISVQPGSRRLATAQERGGGASWGYGGEEFFQVLLFRYFFGTRAKLPRGSFQVVLEKFIVKKMMIMA